MTKLYKNEIQGDSIWYVSINNTIKESALDKVLDKHCGYFYIDNNSHCCPDQASKPRHES